MRFKIVAPIIGTVTYIVEAESADAAVAKLQAEEPDAEEYVVEGEEGTPTEVELIEDKQSTALLN